MPVFDRSDDPGLAVTGGPVETAPRQPPVPLEPTTGQLTALLEMVATAELTLVDVLRHLAEEAEKLLPAAVGVLVAVRRQDGRREVVATTDSARAVDELQLGLREGPLLDSTAGCRPIRSPDLTRDERWPRLARSVGTEAVRAAFCVPLSEDGVPLGTLSAYADAADAFDERARRLVVRLAGSSGPAVGEVLVRDRVRRLTLRLDLPAADRRAVAEAVAVLGAEHAVGTDEALTVLQLLSRSEHQDLAAAARAVVRARSGGAPPS